MVLTLPIFPAIRLADLQPAILTMPSVIALLSDLKSSALIAPDFSACERQADLSLVQDPNSLLWRVSVPGHSTAPPKPQIASQTLAMLAPLEKIKATSYKKQ